MERTYVILRYNFFNNEPPEHSIPRADSSQCSLVKMILDMSIISDSMSSMVIVINARFVIVIFLWATKLFMDNYINISLYKDISVRL